MLNFSSPIFFSAVKKLTMVALTSTSVENRARQLPRG